MSLEVHFLFYQSKLHKIANKQTNETKKSVSCFSALSPIVWQPCVWMTAPLQCPHYWQAVLKKVLREAESSPQQILQAGGRNS